MRKFTGDFETTADFDDCRVWAWGLCEIGNPDYFEYGNSIDGFMDFIENFLYNPVIYFHNAKFDFQFIISYLLMNNYTWVDDKTKRDNRTFSTLITDSGQFYCLDVWFKVGNKQTKKVRFLDSLKILNFSVEKIAKDFNLPISKLKIDYTKKREIGHKLTNQERDYLRNDVEIMSRALEKVFELGLTKMTIGSNALAEFKSMTKNFDDLLPIFSLRDDAKVRSAYKGGFTYLNPLYKEQETGCGVVFDKNSMYPAKMTQEILPYGWGRDFVGKYQNDDSYPLYIQTLTCTFNLKPGKIPSIQLKNYPSFKMNEYLETSNDQPVTLSLCTPDFDLFMDNYDVDVIEWGGGVKFHGMKGIFTKYVNKWTQSKIQAKKAGNGALYTISKLMLNSCYGKTGLNPRCAKKMPYLDENKVVRYHTLPVEERKPVYVPLATFITGYARADIIRSSQAIRDYSLQKYGFDAYVYSDTDSIHCLLNDEDVKELSKIMDIDDYKLGAWKLESKFKRGKYLRQKCYIEEQEDGQIVSTIAGLPKKLAPLITFDNFKVGFSTKNLDSGKLAQIGNKLAYKYVPGGVVLVDTDFQIL